MAINTYPEEFVQYDSQGVEVLHKVAAFGESLFVEPTPIVQVYAMYGVRDDMQQLIAGNGSISEVDSNFVVQSGTGATNITSLLTEEQAQYRAGQGLKNRWTALFETSAANSIQASGFINAEDGFVFGYDGTEFGIARGHGGIAELQELTITTPAAGAENATITINNTPYVVPLTAGTVEHNAWEISEWLRKNVPNFFFSSNKAVVQALFVFPLALGTFAFTSATAVAAWAQQTVGTPPLFDWVPMADWSNPPSWTIDPTKGNVFEIQIQYLGYGGIRFYVENPNNSNLELVHVYGYANENIVPSVSNPTFRIGWTIQNLGNTTNLTIRGSSAGAFVEGKIIFDERSRTVSETIVNLGATQVNFITIRNRYSINNRVNRISAYPHFLLISAAHNKPVIFHMHIGDEFTGDMLYDYIDEANSAIEFCTTPDAAAADVPAVSVEGRGVLQVRTRSTQPIQFDLRNIFKSLRQGEALTISVLTDSGTGAEADASLVWVEDP